MNSIELATADGPCRAAVFTPTTGSGPWPGVLFFMDGVGFRPALYPMAERIAAQGYVVVMPDVFHRAGSYDPAELKKGLFDPAQRPAMREKYMAPAMKPESARMDVEAVLSYFDTRKDVKPSKIATTGYCMGGLLSLTAAGNFPDRVALAASFHGGGLASDQPNSPHLLAPKMKARVFVAGAIEDASFPDEMKKKLEDALTAAKVTHTLETWPAKHGWCVADMPVYDATQAERHYTVLFEQLRQCFNT